MPKTETKFHTKLQACINTLTLDNTHRQWYCQHSHWNDFKPKCQHWQSFGSGDYTDARNQKRMREGFNHSLTSKTVTMAISKKMKTGSGTLFDTELIYNKVMSLMSTRILDLKHLFQHELVPIPMSMFTDNGLMRPCTTKSVLEWTLQSNQSLWP